MDNQDKICTRCGESFESARELKDHQRTEHARLARQRPVDSELDDPDFGAEETAA